MVDDSERREVARRLRETADEIEPRGFSSGDLLHFIEISAGTRTYSGKEVFYRLADLIDPDMTSDRTNQREISLSASPIARDALLELADEAKKCAWYFGLNHDNDELKDRLEEAAADFSDFAKRIREACGEVES